MENQTQIINETILKLNNRGKPQAQIANKLNAMNLPCAFGRRWSQSTVSRYMRQALNIQRIKKANHAPQTAAVSSTPTGVIAEILASNLSEVTKLKLIEKWVK